MQEIERRHDPHDLRVPRDEEPVDAAGDHGFRDLKSGRVVGDREERGRHDVGDAPGAAADPPFPASIPSAGLGRPGEGRLILGDVRDRDDPDELSARIQNRGSRDGVLREKRHELGDRVIFANAENGAAHHIPGEYFCQHRFGRLEHASNGGRER